MLPKLLMLVSEAASELFMIFASVLFILLVLLMRSQGQQLIVCNI